MGFVTVVRHYQPVKTLTHLGGPVSKFGFGAPPPANPAIWYHNRNVRNLKLDPNGA